MHQVVNYNTGNYPDPEILFEGSKSECDQFVTDNRIPMKGNPVYPSGIGVDVLDMGGTGHGDMSYSDADPGL